MYFFIAREDPDLRHMNLEKECVDNNQSIAQVGQGQDWEYSRPVDIRSKELDQSFPIKGRNMRNIEDKKGKRKAKPHLSST